MMLGPQFNQPLYHGTHRSIPDRVKSANEAGVPTHYRYIPQSAEHAFASTDEDVAWDFADQGSAWSEFRGGPGTVRPRTHVYGVSPHPDMEPGKYHHEFSEWRAPHFDVQSRIDIRPGRQGTLPVNWNQFLNPGKRIGDEDSLNHPSDEHIEEGHPGGSLNQTHLRSRHQDTQRFLEGKNLKAQDEVLQGRLF